MDAILLIDDNKAYCEQIKKTLALRNFNLHYESDVQKALDKALNASWDVILLDLVFDQDLKGLELLERIKKAKPQVPVIMVSGTATLDSAMEALQKGAFDFVEKPIDVDRMIVSIRHALDQKHLSELNQNLINEFYSSIATETWGQTITQALKVLENLEDSVERLLLIGEKGTGKELVAKLIHFKSNRRFWPFISFHCDTYNKEDEYVLFGKESSLENPVTADSLICKADKGTLFLGEISRLSLEGQKKLVRFIHENYYMPKKGNQKETLNIRLITSSSVDLQSLVQNGAFSEELFHILKTLTFRLPPLCQRSEEIPPLVDHFLTETAREFNRKKPEISAEAMELLKKQHWTKNISELKKVIWHVLFFNDSLFIDKSMVEGALIFYRMMQKIQQKKPYSEVAKDLKEFYRLNKNSESSKFRVQEMDKKYI